MSLEAFTYREEMLDLREKLLEVEAHLASGAETHSLEEVRNRVEEFINGKL